MFLTESSQEKTTNTSRVKLNEDSKDLEEEKGKDETAVEKTGEQYSFAVYDF